MTARIDFADWYKVAEELHYLARFRYKKDLLRCLDAWKAWMHTHTQTLQLTATEQSTFDVLANNMRSAQPWELPMACEAIVAWMQRYQDNVIGIKG